MTTTQITNIAHLLDLTDAVGDFIDHYDMDALHADYLAAIRQQLPDGIHVYTDGDVIADLDLADTARNIDWKELTDSIDITDMLDGRDISLQLLANVVQANQEYHGAAQHRIDVIRAAKDSGIVIVEEIAKAAGLTRDGVYKLLARADLESVTASRGGRPDPSTYAP